MKYIFVIWWVISSVGKGVTAASLAKILQSKWYRTTNIKCDMYVNVDAGTINPFEHGEVFVGADGIEADQDLWNYERFAGQKSRADHYITTWQVYQEVIRRERNLEYDGEDVEVVPDVPNEIIRRIEHAGQVDASDITIVEFGGTVGEYQLLLFLEAARMMKYRDPADVSIVMVSYLPVPATVGEMKTKPTQYAIRTLNSAWLQADFVVCRSGDPIPESKKQKLATVCSIDSDRIIAAPDCEVIYDVPLILDQQRMGDLMLETLWLDTRPSDLTTWQKLVSITKSVTQTVTVAIIGKYVSEDDAHVDADSSGSAAINTDTYISVLESIKYAARQCGKKPVIKRIHSESYETDPAKVKELDEVDAVVIPWGFGTRGIEWKIIALKYIRENNIPYLGLCYGMQLMAIEYARNVLWYSDAASEEWGTSSEHMIIHTMEEQRAKIEQNNYGWSMRLGSYLCQLSAWSQSLDMYTRHRSDDIVTWDEWHIWVRERHRHRYEFNSAYTEAFEAWDIRIAGVDQESWLVEIIENSSCTYMVWVQFHPEFSSRLDKAHPLFVGLIEALGEK